MNSIGAQLTVVPPEDELLLIKKATIGNALNLKNIFRKYENKQLKNKDFTKEYSRPELDLVPSQLKPNDLFEVFDYIDQLTEKNATMIQADLEESFKVHTPENAQIVDDILDKGTPATVPMIIEAVKGIKNIKKLKGLLEVDPFVEAMT